MTKVSPLAPKRFPALPPVAGVRIAAGASGVRYKGRSDLMVAVLAPQTTVAGVFTQSLTASAPVEWCRRVLAGGRARALVVNSGNANAFTGAAGVESVRRTTVAAAKTLATPAKQVFTASTGVIGEPLDAGKIAAALPGLRARLKATGWPAAARAITTTDTFPKGATRTARIGETTAVINGIAKGSGMIAPNMATMLAFVFTDAAIPAPVLRRIFSAAIDRTFNCITVDGDTSTSDTALLFATAKARHDPVRSASDPKLRDFRVGLEAVLGDLARQVVRDGEGASKFVTVTVSGAESARAARRIGLGIANSPLVKTAIAGEDANWGRIVMAVGNAGERADRDRLSIVIGGVAVAAEGMVVNGYDEAPVVRHMKGRDIDIAVDVGVGRGRARVWTCDLTGEYVRINADYRS
ncbi:MAG: bifunctional glutamate N-acetyltransferase/amino-acid acetyltransferase ArgJ [Rhodospirillales bacterium]|jgi:glutamate N-acetyltransferase/amino-acid N-acetyltransferase|nr:bifunctional glutamate N-acetyltransferase/amino-acid acetyltransferase ArgJ [Rhodospirillales bacterium]MDP6804708.1 bifunctional glutamate N-acetyltransferase/amino-acid acetyltransferase ArgJ [Rhodospirillales bacterium]